MSWIEFEVSSRAQKLISQGYDVDGVSQTKQMLNANLLNGTHEWNVSIFVHILHVGIAYNCFLHNSKLKEKKVSFQRATSYRCFNNCYNIDCVSYMFLSIYPTVPHSVWSVNIVLLVIHTFGGSSRVWLMSTVDLTIENETQKKVSFTFIGLGPYLIPNGWLYANSRFHFQ